MSAKTEYKPRSVKVYDAEEFEKLIKGVHVASCMLTEAPQVVDEESVIRRVNALTLGGPTGGDRCSCCGAGPFETRAHQTAHYKHHWHAYNLKRRLFGKQPLSLPQFNLRQDDNSSVSGSDSDTEESGGNNVADDLFAAATRHCKAFYTNAKGQVFCMYRCVLHHRKEALSTDGEGHAWVDRCTRFNKPTYLRWAVFMVSGGHFAGAVYAGGVPTLHKTLHSYIVRRGQGQAQGARDQHGNAPKSAGASLRRYNQAQFTQHVQDILVGWSEEILNCSLVLYRASGPINQNVLFGKGSPLAKDDIRLRAFPFPTRKPTFKELQRAHATVASIDVYDTMELFQKALIASTAKPTVKAGAEGSGSDRTSRKAQKSPAKPIDRAKSREIIPRELPTVVTSSEDEGPCFIDSETPAGWIKALSEQSSNGVISNSRRDLLNNNRIVVQDSSEDEGNKATGTQVRGQVPKKTKKKAKSKPEEPKVVVKKIPANVKKMWKSILSGDQTGLDTILEHWEGELGVEEACNMADPNDGNTALHKAAIAAKPDMVTQILTVGGDPCARNLQLQTPYAASPHQDTRLAFRVFQASHPDKYNYAKAHIPGPITPELQEQEKERKAQQKRAKRQREKEKHVDKIRSNRFLELNDAQKVKAVTEARCFLCGSKLPKDVFAYERFSFCTIKCLQNHRNLRPLNLPA